MSCCQVSCVLCRLCIFPRIKRNFAALMPEINSVMYLVVPWVALPSASRRRVLRVSARWRTGPFHTCLGFAMFYQCYRFSCCCKSRIGETVQLWGYEHLWYLWHLWHPFGSLIISQSGSHSTPRMLFIVTEWPCVASWFAWLGCSHESGLRRRWSGDDALDSVLRLAAALAAIFLCVYLAVMVQTKQSMFQHAKSMCDLFVSFSFCCLIRLRNGHLLAAQVLLLLRSSVLSPCDLPTNPGSCPIDGRRKPALQKWTWRILGFAQ